MTTSLYSKVRSFNAGCLYRVQTANQNLIFSHPDSKPGCSFLVWTRIAWNPVLARRTETTCGRQFHLDTCVSVRTPMSFHCPWRTLRQADHRARAEKSATGGAELLDRRRNSLAHQRARRQLNATVSLSHWYDITTRYALRWITHPLR